LIPFSLPLTNCLMHKTFFPAQAFLMNTARLI